MHFDRPRRGRSGDAGVSFQQWRADQRSFLQTDREQLRNRTIPARRRHRRREKSLWRYWWSHRVALIVVGITAILVVRVQQSPWPVTVTLRHLVAARNCDAARSVGLAPANRGEPGYWAHNDADNDGIACEPCEAVDRTDRSFLLPFGWGRRSD